MRERGLLGRATLPFPYNTQTGPYKAAGGSLRARGRDVLFNYSQG